MCLCVFNSSQHPPFIWVFRRPCFVPKKLLINNKLASSFSFPLNSQLIRTRWGGAGLICTDCVFSELIYPDICTLHQIVDELRDQILKLRFPHRVQNKEATPKTKRKIVGNPSPSKSPSLPAAKPALSDRPCVVVLNKPLEKLLIRSVHEDITAGMPDLKVHTKKFF